MKTLFAAITCGCALAYGEISFVFQNANVTTWSEGMRVCLLLFGAAQSLMSGCFIDDHQKVAKDKDGAA